MLMVGAVIADEHDGSVPSAPQAFERGAELKRQGDLRAAAVQFRRVIQLTPSGSDLGKAAEEELHVNLPVLEAQRLLVTGDAHGAQQVLRHAIELNRDNPHRIWLLSEMLRNISVLQGIGSNVGDVDGQAVLNKVQEILIGYRARTGSYPRGYAELNRILPPNQAPLSHFDVIYYKGGRDEFVVSLRNKTDQSNTVTLHKTGLLQ